MITRSLENVIVVVRRMFSSEAVLHSWLKSISGPGKGQGKGSSSESGRAAGAMSSTAPSSSSTSSSSSSSSSSSTGASSSSSSSSSSTSTASSSVTLLQLGHLPSLPSSDCSPEDVSVEHTSDSETDSSCYDCSGVAYVGPEYCWHIEALQGAVASMSDFDSFSSHLTVRDDVSRAAGVEVRLEVPKVTHSRRPAAASTDVLCGDPDSLYRELSRHQPTKVRSSNSTSSRRPAPLVAPSAAPTPTSESSTPPSSSAVPLSSVSLPAPATVEAPPSYLLSCPSSSSSSAAAPKKNYAAIRRPVQCFSLLNGQVPISPTHPSCTGPCCHPLSYAL